jgi:hypothetical protein
MPIINSKDSKGPYYKFGEKGTKYYYVSGNKLSRELAYKRCVKQGRAIKRSENLRKEFKKYVLK